MAPIIEYFAKDPLKILYLIGGTGGLWFWILQWRGRIRVKIRSISHTFDTAADPNIKVELRFEIENLGDSPTSIEPDIKVTGYDQHRRQWSDVLALGTPVRKLEPHTPEGCLAVGNVGADYVFWIYRTYRFRLTKGRNRVVRFRTQPRNDQISLLRYIFEVALFRVFGWLPFFESSRMHR